MHFEAQFPKGASLFRSLIASIKNLTPQTNLYCSRPTGNTANVPSSPAAAAPLSEGGLQVQFMESLGGKALVAWQITSDAFKSFTMEPSETISICVRPLELHRYLNYVQDDDTLTLRADVNQQGVAEMYELYVESEDRSRKCLYEIDCAQMKSTLNTLPRTNYHAAIQLSSAEFEKIIKSMSEVSDQVNITVTQTSATFLSSGRTSSVQIGLVQKPGSQGTPNGSSGSDKPTLYATDSPNSKSQPFKILSFQQRVSQTFDVKYLLTFAMASSFAQVVTLHMCRATPMKVGFALYDEPAQDPTALKSPTYPKPISRPTTPNAPGRVTMESGSGSAPSKNRIGQILYYLAGEEVPSSPSFR